MPKREKIPGKRDEISVEEYKNLIEVKTVGFPLEFLTPKNHGVAFYQFIITDKYDLYISHDSHAYIANTIGVN